MGGKRRYNKSGLKLYKKYGAKTTVAPAAKTLQAAVRRAVSQSVARNIETKTSITVFTDGTEIAHNNFITLTSNPLITGQGVADPTINNVNNRIGDQITCKGVSLKMMIELNERYSDVTFRLMVVKCARGDTPTRTSLFTGESGNKMLDSFDKERYSLLYQKFFKITARNMANIGTDAGAGSGTNVVPTDTAGVKMVQSRATRIIKVWIDGKKFARNGVITYQAGGASAKFFDYHVLLYAYSNYTTLQDVWNVGRINDFVCKMYFKDA